MFHRFPSNDREFNENMRQWRKQAAIRYFLAVFILFAAPILAGAVARFVSPEALDTRFVTATIGSWERAYFISAIVIILFIELISLAIVKLGEQTEERDPRIEALLRPLIEQSGLKWPVRIIELGESKILNAGALRSFSYGRMIILMGDTSKLPVEELRAVLAHEVGHLAMRDVRTNHVLLALRLAVRVVNFLIFLSLLATIALRNYELTWFLGVAYIITLMGARLAKMFFLSYSRVCEYRADAIGVQLTSENHRKHLISAIKKVKEIGVMVMLSKKEQDEVDWNKTHPSLKKRAEALGVALKELSVRIGPARS